MADPNADDVAPYLLAVDPQHDADFVTRLVQAMSGLPALSALHTTLSQDALAAHLASYVSVRIEPDEQRFLLRFADTRVLPALVAALDESQRRQFLGSISAWRHLTPDGRVATLAGPGEACGAGPLRLSAGQFAALVEVSEPDAILGALRERGAIPAGLSPSAAYQRVADSLCRASKQGVLQPADRITWVAFALASDHDAPWEHEPLAPAVARAKAGQAPLADALQACLDGA